MPSAKNYDPTAPLQRKGRSRKKLGLSTTGGGSAYASKEVIPGIKHVVEGRDDLSYSGVESATMRYHGSGKNPNEEQPGRVTVTTKKGKKAQKANKAIDKQIAGFGLEDAARARIRTIADPEALKTVERKKAARRRMAGRLGTLLSERDTLG